MSERQSRRRGAATSETGEAITTDTPDRAVSHGRGGGSELRRYVRLILWRLNPRCVCGEYRIARYTTMELRGVKHCTDRPCFHCDTYGEPDDDWWTISDA
jgi:hypothetical protein